MPYLVARLHDGDPFDYLHAVSEDGERHLICLDPSDALRFDAEQAAEEAAGACMDRQPEEDYGAISAAE